MPQPELQPGDRIIALAALTRTAAILTGAVLMPVLGWLVKHSVWLCLGLFVAGIGIGWLVGMLAGQFLFPATAGNVVVVKVGRSSLPSTLKAAIPSALLVAAIAALGFCSVSVGQRPVIIVTSLSIGLGIGIGTSLLSSFL